jgi:hypothetical protein
MYEAETNSGLDDAVESPGVEVENNTLDDQSFEDTGEQEVLDEPELEEVEHEGRKYKLPKALVSERMMQQDYTRKTTELAEARKALEAERAAEVQANEELREDYGRVHALKAQVKAFRELNWNALNAADPGEAQSLWMTYQQVQQALGEAEGSLKTKVDGRLQSQRETLAKAMQETGQTLAREIKGWGPELANNLAGFAAKNYGVSQRELAEAADPRLWKLLHDAYKGRQAQQTQRVAEDQKALEEVRPARNVNKGSSPPTGLDDRLSSAEWQRRRNAQIAAKNRR